MTTALSIDAEAVISTYRWLQKLSKRELLCLHRTEVGAITPAAAYRHTLIGGIMHHRFGDGAIQIVRETR